MAEDPRVIAQRGVNPLTGSYLSKEERVALFRRARVSSTAFGGGGGGLVRAGGGQVAGRQTLAIVKTNQESISGIQQQLNVIRARVEVLNNGISDVSNLLTIETNAENQRLLQQQEQEKQQADAEIKLGRENLLEQKLQTALVAPVQKVLGKAQDFFGRIRQALLYLLGGWFATAGLEALKAKKEGLTAEFEKIKKNIISGLFYAGSALLAINAGFGLFIRLATSLAAKIASLAAKVLLLPFRLLGSLGKSVMGFGSRLIGRGGAAATQAAKTAGGGNAVTRLFGRIFSRGGARAATGAAAKTGSRFVPGLNVLAGGTFAAMDFARGDVLGGMLNVGSMVPGFGVPFAMARLGLEGARMMGGDDKELSSAEQPKVQPQEQKVPTMEGMNLDMNLESMGVNSFESEKKAEEQITQITQNNNMSLLSMPSQTFNQLGPVSEPAPQVVLSDPGQTSAGAAPPQKSSATANDIPSIPTSDPSNFYRMYTQLTYNVVG